MQQQDLLRILSAATVTQGLEPADLTTLLSYTTIETTPQGWMVLAEGQRGEALYVVLYGHFKVMLLALDHRDHPNRVRDIYLHTLSPGDCFGDGLGARIIGVIAGGNVGGQSFGEGEGLEDHC